MPSHCSISNSRSSILSFFNDKGRVRTMSSIEAVCDNTTKFNDYTTEFNDYTTKFNDYITKFDGYNQNVVQRSMSGLSELPKNIYG